MPRTKGSKNKKSVCLKSPKVYPVRLDMDLQDWADSHPNKNEYINNLVRRDYEEYLKNMEGSV